MTKVKRSHAGSPTLGKGGRRRLSKMVIRLREVYPTWLDKEWKVITRTSRGRSEDREGISVGRDDETDRHQPERRQNSLLQRVSLLVGQCCATYPDPSCDHRPVQGQGRVFSFDHITSRLAGRNSTPNVESQGQAEDADLSECAVWRCPLLHVRLPSHSRVEGHGETSQGRPKLVCPTGKRGRVATAVHPYYAIDLDKAVEEGSELPARADGRATHWRRLD